VTLAVVTHFIEGPSRGSQGTPGLTISRWFPFGVVQFRENSLLQPARARASARQGTSRLIKGCMNRQN
jgi:hypothetical protein